MVSRLLVAAGFLMFSIYAIKVEVTDLRCF